MVSSALPQSRDLWHTTVRFSGEPPEGAVELCITGFEDEALSVFVHKKTAPEHWVLELATLGKPEPEHIRTRLAVLETLSSHINLFDFSTLAQKPVEDRDWLEHVHRNFPPIATERFFIYGSHYTGEKPADKIALRIDAATAFGSGEHETTAGCLMALERLAGEGKRFENILDMGCGSGILGIAALKLWPAARLTAVDIDAEAVLVTARHAGFNDVTLQSEAGDGYAAPLCRQNAPYDLVLSNILSGPLIVMAPALSRVLAPGGFVILAGLLTRQQDAVAAAHRAQGLETVFALQKGNWPTLACQKT